MKKYLLALESSCDETSCAILDLDGNLLSNIVSTQINVHTLYGGVYPEVASRLHIENINFVIKDAIKQANIELDEIAAIAVTSGPGLIGALHVGIQTAKTLALTLNVPLIPVHHLVGHIYANSFAKEIEFPSLALVISGGHTEIVYMKKEFKFEILGSTQDDAIGEAYDKVARIIGLGYPGGPKIDKAAKEGKPVYKMPYPHTDNPFNVSYSGLKTYVNNYVHNAEQKGEKINVNDMCASFQKRAIDMIVDKTLLVLDSVKVKQLVVAGGVAANSYLREQIVKRVGYRTDVVIPPLWCCGDNAAMIGKAAVKLFKRKHFAKLSLQAKPSWSLLDYKVR